MTNGNGDVRVGVFARAGWAASGAAPHREQARAVHAIGSVAAGGSAGVAGDDDAVLVGEDDSLHSVS